MKLTTQNEQSLNTLCKRDPAGLVIPLKTDPSIHSQRRTPEQPLALNYRLRFQSRLHVPTPSLSLGVPNQKTLEP